MKLGVNSRRQLRDEDYDQSQFTLAEVSHFIAAAARSEGERRLVVLRVEDCIPEGLFAAHVFTDLVGVDDPQERRNRILAGGAKAARSPRRRGRGYSSTCRRATPISPAASNCSRVCTSCSARPIPRRRWCRSPCTISAAPARRRWPTEYAHRHAASYSGVWWARAEGRTLLIASLRASWPGGSRRVSPASRDQEKAARRRPGAACSLGAAVPADLRQRRYARDAARSGSDRRRPRPDHQPLGRLDGTGDRDEARPVRRRSRDRVPAEARRAKRPGGSGEARGGARHICRSRSIMPAPIAGSPDRASTATARRSTPESRARLPVPPIRRASPPPSGSRSSRSWPRIRRPRRCSGDSPSLRRSASRSIWSRTSVADEDERAEALMALAGVSLVEHEHADPPAVSVHRLVQAATRARLADRQAAHAERATLCLAQAFPELAYGNPNVWPQCAVLLPHVLALSDCYRVGKHEVAGGRRAAVRSCRRLSARARRSTVRPSRCFARRSRSRNACMGAAIHGSRTRSAISPCCCRRPAVPMRPSLTTAR